MTDAFPSQVTGESGRPYRLTRSLGRGGQGAVFAVEGGRHAVKLLPGRSDARRERLRHQLAYVRRLPLDGLPVARPLELLRPPDVGYVMELMTEMASLAGLMQLPRGEASHTAWYFRGGGLRRRLRLLALAADILAALHSRGLVYGDLSPNNVLVSGSADAHEVWFIDADNFHFSGNPTARPIFTPYFGAPELISNRSAANSLTDAHAFAVLAFHTLAVVHPLLGDLVNDGPPELEEQALRGELPWIDDPDDDTNRSRDGIARDVVLSPLLRKLAERAFGSRKGERDRSGLVDPQRRPGVAEWGERLHAAADYTLGCGNSTCRGTFYANAERCPWCNHRRPAFVQVWIHRWQPQQPLVRKGLQEPLPVLALGADGPLLLTNRTIELTDGLRGRAPRVELTLVPRGIRIKALDDARCCLVPPDAQRRPIELAERPHTIPVDPRQPSWRLHFRSPDEPQRVATFKLVPETH